MSLWQAFNLYWITSSSVQLAIVLAFRNESFRKYLGVPDYLPGSKLEKQNIGLQGTLAPQKKVKIYSSKPKAMKDKGKLALKQSGKASS